MTTVETKFEDLLEKQRQLKAQFQQEAQALFKETFKEFFDKNPGITAVIWTQYTPYFNDGDECVFSVGDVYFTNAKDLDELSSWGDYEGEDEDTFSESNLEYVMKSDSHYYAAAQKAILKAGNIDVASCKALSSIIGSDEMEDVMRAMFDDHVRVIATRDGFDVEEYSHD